MWNTVHNRKEHQVRNGRWGWDDIYIWHSGNVRAQTAIVILQLPELAPGTQTISSTAPIDISCGGITQYIRLAVLRHRLNIYFISIYMYIYISCGFWNSKHPNSSPFTAHISNAFGLRVDGTKTPLALYNTSLLLSLCCRFTCYRFANPTLARSGGRLTHIIWLLYKTIALFYRYTAPMLLYFWLRDLRWNVYNKGKNVYFTQSKIYIHTISWWNSNRQRNWCGVWKCCIWLSI